MPEQGLTGIAAIEAEMRDRLAAKDASITDYMDICEDLSRKLEASHAENVSLRELLFHKDARIAELASAVAGKVKLVEPTPEAIAWAEGVFAAEDDKNATIEDLSRKLEASRHRVAELEKQTTGLEGHGRLCYYCGDPCSSLAGNPMMWPIPLCHSDDPGVVKWHHTGCVSSRLERIAEMEASRHRVAELEKTDEITMAEVHDNFNELMERGDIMPVQAAVYLVTRERSKTAARQVAKDARIAEFEAALELALTGGNHIANQLIGMVGADFASKYPPDMDVWQVAEKLADPVAHDLWCCWSAMMRARSTREGKQTNSRHGLSLGRTGAFKWTSTKKN
jgi:hypothetical protein